jgi:U4/U6 small nuclear ribonucleoprotein PRP3
LQQIHSTPAAKKDEQKAVLTGEVHLRYGYVDIIANPPPEVEWWDAAILKEPSYDNLETNLKEDLVYQAQLEHPLPIPPAVKITDSGPIPLMLTPRERRKLRTQTRMQREKEQQQKIRLGLIPPPPPKANLKNFMRVHLNDGTQDPTKLERQIRREMEQRIQNHEQRNQARKLTPQQKKKKKLQKLQEDESKELQVALFRIADLSHPANRFKINVKASELGITGCVITCGGFQGSAQSTLTSGNQEPMILIIAEGGIKAIRKYKHVVLERIDWSRKISPIDGKEENDEESDDPDSAARNKHKCALIWQGILKERGFKTFKFQNFPDAQTAQKYLKDLGLESYYNMAASWAGEAEIVEQEEE